MSRHEAPGASEEETLPPPVGAPPAAQEWLAQPEPAEREEANPALLSIPPAAALPLPPHHTHIVEEGVIPRRVRRPIDLLRLVILLIILAGIIVVAYFATGTVEGLDHDIIEASQQIPSFVRLLLEIIASIGVFGVPVAAGVDLLIRRRGRQLLDAMLASIATILLLLGTAVALNEFADSQLLLAITGAAKPHAVQPVAVLLGAFVTFAIIGELFRRIPWAIATIVVIAASAVVSSLTSPITIAGLAASVLVGMALGLATRYTFGTTTSRPNGAVVVETLARHGISLTLLQASRSTGYGRRYLGRDHDGLELEVVVLDRDLEGSGVMRAIWRNLRVGMTSEGRGTPSMRDQLNQSALLTYSVEKVGGPTPPLLCVSQVGDDSALLAYRHEQGMTFARAALQDKLGEEDLRQAWQALKTLQVHDIAHRRLTAEHLIQSEGGQFFLVGLAGGSIAASDVQLRIDVAELLCTLAMLTTPELAMATGREVLGDAAMQRALPVLQRVAMSEETRRLLRKEKKLLGVLRNSLIELTGEEQVETIRLERFRPRTLIMMTILLVAAYVLVSQLGQMNLVELFRTADWRWVGIGAIFSAITYVGAAMSLTGFVPEKIPLGRSVLAQVAGDFATLISPPTLGAVAINLRFLQKTGKIHPALAAASVGVSQVFAFVIHLGLLAVAAFLAGTQTDFSIDPPRPLLIGLAVLVVLIMIVAPLPPVRRLIIKRIQPTLRQVIPRLLTVAQRPWKVVEGMGGIILLNVSYCIILIVSVWAFGGQANIFAISVVYLAGSTVGQAAPTPGGLGAVEAVMTAGLVGSGLSSEIALSSVLLFRLLTFWIPTIPGWFAFHWLQKRDSL